MSSVLAFSTEEAEKIAEATAHDYLQTVKQWKYEEYCLEKIRLEGTPEMPLVRLNGTYKADRQSQQRGGGQSVQLQIDVLRGKVVQELAFQ